MTKTSAILLAAGLSSRMNGPNKLLLTLEGSTIIERSYRELAKSSVAEIIVVTGRDQSLVQDSLSLRKQDRFVHNPDFSLGMTTSIQKGVSVAQGDAFMICLGDMPKLKADHYNQLMADFVSVISHNPKAILLPLVNAKRANPVIFSAQHRSAILAHTAMNGCRRLVKDNPMHLTEYITDDLAFLSDIDTAEDYRQLYP
ncbi:MAG: hypothetical protein Roseis2KO_54450 [Roseivirga sp.]